MENKISKFEGKEILNVDEAAEFLGMTKGTLYHLTYKK